MLVICFFEFEVVYSLQGYQDIVHILALPDFTGDSFIQLHISGEFELYVVPQGQVIQNLSKGFERKLKMPLFRYSSLSKLEVDTTMRLFTNDTFS